MDRFTVMSEISRQYPRFNAVGTQLTARFLPPSDNQIEVVRHFQDSVNALFGYALRNCDDHDMVGLIIRNEINQQDKAIGVSFRRKDQISSEVIWSVFDKVSQSNSRFNAMDTLIVEVNSVRMPSGSGIKALKFKGRPLSNLIHLKRSIVRVKAEKNCLAHALIIAIARITGDPNYKSYSNGYKLGPVVQQLLETTGISLEGGGGIPELTRFQDHFKEYRIVVYSGLNCD
jgi:hypothetical protein